MEILVSITAQCTDAIVEALCITDYNGREHDLRRIVAPFFVGMEIEHMADIRLGLLVRSISAHRRPVTESKAIDRRWEPKRCTILQPIWGKKQRLSLFKLAIGWMLYVSLIHKFKCSKTMRVRIYQFRVNTSIEKGSGSGSAVTE